MAEGDGSGDIMVTKITNARFNYTPEEDVMLMSIICRKFVIRMLS